MPPSKQYDLLAYYDCLSGLAYALILHNNGRLPDPDYSLLHQSYKEIILLASKGEFLKGQKDVCHVIDVYMTERLPKLGATFSYSRNREQRLVLDMVLLMREQCLHTIDVVIKIANALCSIKTPQTLQIWDNALATACLNAIDELKNTYLLFDHFPTKISFPHFSERENKQITSLLYLHHAPKEMPAEIYTGGKTQFYFLHHLTQTMLTLSKLSSELPLLAIPELREKPVKGLSDADSIIDTHVEIITDCLIIVLAACENAPGSIEFSVIPALDAMHAANQTLTYALNLVLQLPRKKRGDRDVPDQTRKKIAEDTRWLTYRQRNIEQAKQKLL